MPYLRAIKLVLYLKGSEFYVKVKNGADSSWLYRKGALFVCAT